FGRIALAQVKAGDRAGAKRTLRQALQTIDSFKEKIQTPDEKYVLGDFVRTSMERVAIAQAQAGDFQAALETAVAAEAEMGTLRQIAVLQAKAGNQAGARSTCTKALGLMSKIAEPSRKISAALEIARTQVEIGDSSASGETLKQALETAATVKEGVSAGANVAFVANALGEIAAVQAMAGDIKGALKTGDAIQKPEGLQKLARALAEAGNGHAALEWAGTRSSPEAGS